MKQKFSLSISKKNLAPYVRQPLFDRRGILILTVSHIYPVMLMQLKAVVFDARIQKTTSSCFLNRRSITGDNSVFHANFHI